MKQEYTKPTSRIIETYPEGILAGSDGSINIDPSTPSTNGPRSNSFFETGFEKDYWEEESEE